MNEREQRRKDLEQAIQEMEANAEIFEMGLKLSARQLRVAYECLLKEGFQPSEALDIIKSRGTGLS